MNERAPSTKEPSASQDVILVHRLEDSLAKTQSYLKEHGALSVHFRHLSSAIVAVQRGAPLIAIAEDLIDADTLASVVQLQLMRPALKIVVIRDQRSTAVNERIAHEGLGTFVDVDQLGSWIVSFLSSSGAGKGQKPLSESTLGNVARQQPLSWKIVGPG